VIKHAGLQHARALVITIPDESTTAMIVSAARDLHHELPVITRVATEEGLQFLGRSGDHNIHVVYPELEGSLEMVHHTLLELGFPVREVHAYTETVRSKLYNPTAGSDADHRTIHELVKASDSIEISWISLPDGSPLIGQSLEIANLRSLTGASIVAIMRNSQLIANPKSMTIFKAGDRIGLIGESDQIEKARAVATPSTPEN
jgi:CPA2 family monovalent cation:H+ antiporter-2